VVESIPSEEVQGIKAETVSFSEDAKAGGDGSVIKEDPPSQKQNSDWSVDRSKDIKAIMASKKEETRFTLREDIYAFLIVAPILSSSFLFSLYVVSLKIAVFVILATGIKYSDNSGESLGATIAKFLLIPVAVAMQEDLMDAFWFIANVNYCPSMLQKSQSATKTKLYFSYALRCCDGILSLYVNFAVMLSTDDVLQIFLNFAALQFLQSIDDVFYELVVQGFFGDQMEHMSVVCTDITLPRRVGADNTKIWCFRVSHLDSIFLVFTMLVCLAAYLFATASIYSIE